MKGFTRQRRDGGSWTCYWESRDPSTGKRRQHSKGGFRTQRAAREHLNVVLGRVATGEWRKDAPLTLAELLEVYWLPAQRSRGLRPSTLSQYEGAARWYLIPALGARKVAALTPTDVSALIEKMRTAKSATGRKGLSARTAQVAVTTLKAATAWALKNGLLGRDPLAGVDRPRLEHKAMRSWSSEDARSFLTHVRDDRLEVAWAFALTRGLRRGEIAGLQWDAVNFAEATLQITRTRISVDGKATESTPKTASGRRTVPLDASLVALLRAHEVAEKAERLRAGEAWEGVGHVFADELGRAYSPDHFGARFRDLVETSGLPLIPLHGTRHTAASLMLASGVSVKVVQEMLGHSSPAITLALYAHTAPSTGHEAGAALSASLLG